MSNIIVTAKLTINEALYDDFLQTLEEKGYVFATFHGGLIKIEKDEVS